MRIALAQAFSAKSAIEMLDSLPKMNGPDVVLMPEYCFSAPDFCDLLAASAERPFMTIVTAMVLPVGRKNLGVTHNRALKIIGGVGMPIYDKMEQDGIGGYSEDVSEANKKAFRDQPQSMFASICNDKQYAKPLMPTVWLIPAYDSTSDSALVPQTGYTGHIFFANGNRNAKRSSYYLNVAEPYHPSKGDLYVSEEIKRDVEDMLEIFIAP